MEVTSWYISTWQVDQEDQEIKANLGHILCSRPASATRDPILKNRTKQNKELTTKIMLIKQNSRKK